jgi:hypothetical protein
MAKPPWAPASPCAAIAPRSVFFGTTTARSRSFRSWGVSLATEIRPYPKAGSSSADMIGPAADQDFGLRVILASAILSLLLRMSIVNPGMVSRPMPMGSPVSGSGWIFP